MIGRLLPTTVVTIEAFEDVVDGKLLSEEEAAIAGATVERRREFATARNCARRALAELGVPEAPLLPGQRREPLWPNGVVGSLTHCSQYRAAAVARRSELASLGIDAEPHAPLPKGVAREIALPDELEALMRLPSLAVAWDRVLFSAKESVYKAWYPLAQRWLDFDDVLIEFAPSAQLRGTFKATLLHSRLTLSGQTLDALAGRYAIRNDLVLTAISIPA